MLSGLGATEKTWSLYLSHWREMLGFSVLFALLVPVEYIFFFAIGGINLLLYNIHAAYGLFMISDIVLIVGALLLLTFLYLLIYFYFCKRIGLVLGKTIGYDKPSLSVLLPLWLIFFLYSLTIFCGTLLLVIPGIIFTIWYLFAPYEFLFNDRRGFAALGASKARVTGRWWLVAWNIVLPTIIFAAVGFIVTVALTLLSHTFFGDSLLFTVISSGLTTLLTVLLPPLLLLLALVVYADTDSPLPPSAA